jgi:UDP-N-acetylmuramoyl-L-alanyl-D-glutamate--2,6-diaminopimelate ligase
MKLSRLMDSLLAADGGGFSGENRSRTSEDPEINSIHYRSGDVIPGGLFVAVPGLKADGHDFIQEALDRGAAAVVAQRPFGNDSRVKVVDNSRRMMGTLGARFYGNPAEALFLIGITGTNGKTTTSLLIEHILTAAEFQVGVIGTIDYHYAGKSFTNPVTTPESLDLQRILAEMRDHGVTHAVMETSSHAIDLDRIQNCWLDLGVFTNLSQDHLDYHGDMDRYWACKKSLFTRHLASGPKKDRAAAVINLQGSRGRALAETVSVPCVRVGQEPGCDIRPDGIRYDLTGITGRILIPDGGFDLSSSLIGAHNLENILCAAGVGSALRLSPFVIQTGIESLRCVPGRLEPVENGLGRFVFVDYAHTPAALENVLTALKHLGGYRIICIFGCGGDRDRDKRPQMGEVVGRLADLAVVTSDNPRTEAPLSIVEAIIPGIRKSCSRSYDPAEVADGFEDQGFVVEPDRRQAISIGISASRPGDIVLLAGKGHETYQDVGGRTLHFDDREEAKRALEAL